MVKEYGAAVSVCVVEMSYLRGACGVTRWDGLSNERCGIESMEVEQAVVWWNG